jgi:hypothetical protein
MAWNFNGIKTTKSINAIRDCFDYIKLVIDANATDTDMLTEGATNLYFTEARVRAALLTGIDFLTSTAVVATDSMLVGLGKLQAQVTAINTELSGKQNSLTTGTGITLASNIISSQNLTQNSQSAAYTFALTDAGKDIYHPSADTTARTFTIPANSSVAFAIGTMITITNAISAGVITLDIATDTLYKAGSGAGGLVTIPPHGMVTIKKETDTVWRWTGVLA